MNVKKIIYTIMLLLIAVIYAESKDSLDIVRAMSLKTKKIFEISTFKKDILNSVVKLDVDANGNIYIWDWYKYSIFVYNNKGDELFRIGKRGEGPGEVRSPSDFFISESFYILDRNALNKYTAKGEFQYKIRLTTNMHRIFLNGDEEGWFLGNKFDSGNFYKSFGSFSNEKYKTIKSFFIEKRHIVYKNKKKYSFAVSHMYTPNVFLEKISKDNFLVAYNMEKRVYIYNSNGKVVKEFDILKKEKSISSKDKEKIYGQFKHLEKKWSKSILRSCIQFPKHMPFFSKIYVDEKKNIYFLRLFDKKDKPEVYYLDVYDMNGVHKSTISTSMLPEKIFKDRIYYISEGQDNDEIKVVVEVITNRDFK